MGTSHLVCIHRGLRMGLKKQRMKTENKPIMVYCFQPWINLYLQHLESVNIPIKIFNTEVLMLFLNICWIFLSPLPRVSSYSCGSFQTFCPFAHADSPTWNTLPSLCFWWKPNDWAQMPFLSWSHPSLELPQYSLRA